MQRFDVHVHSGKTAPNPEELLNKLAEAGFYGCCLFSNRPLEFDPVTGSSFEDRMNAVLDCTAGYEDRLFPVLWIHPDEENILEKVKIAADRGICAFKIICNNFFVSDEKCMQVLRAIAALDKPVFFHSGILWDSQNSSIYNRPLNWEALIDIEGLRFSMGHCSWPWTDECIALYGKFLNALTTRKSAEMFFDMTPGTPENYRNGLLEKLFTTGYDVGENILFGTDATAHRYASDWGSKWLRIDGDLMDQMGVSQAVRQQLYHDNLLRFLGKKDRNAPLKSPLPDDANTWQPCNPEVPKIIEKWYLALGFPSEFNREFYKALETIRISDAISIDTYDINCEDGLRNLLSFLYMCEALEAKYKTRGIDRKILMDTLSDLVRWCVIWSNLKGSLYLGELGWLKNHLCGNLYMLGRLQFAMGSAEHAIPEAGIAQGDPVMEVHIPEEGPLSADAVEAAFAEAKTFFAAHFPEFAYSCFTCHSWLLDPTLQQLLPPQSNILRFQNRFTVTEAIESYALLRYIFRWNTTRVNLAYAQPSSNFAAKVKELVRGGKKFYEAIGFIQK